MRYLIDTNIFVYAVIDRDSLDRDVTAILQEPDTVLYMSAESVRELIVGYRNKGLCFQTLEVSRSNGHFNRTRVLHQNTSPEKRAHADLCTIRN